MSELNGVPCCTNEECPSYDGKRCKILGYEPTSLCEPYVVELMKRLDQLDERKVVGEELDRKISELMIQVSDDKDLAALADDVIRSLKEQISYSDQFHEELMLGLAEIAGTTMKAIGLKTEFTSDNMSAEEMMRNDFYKKLRAEGTGPSWWRRQSDKIASLEAQILELRKQIIENAKGNV